MLKHKTNWPKTFDDGFKIFVHDVSYRRSRIPKLETLRIGRFLLLKGILNRPFLQNDGRKFERFKDKLSEKLIPDKKEHLYFLLTLEMHYARWYIGRENVSSCKLKIDKY